MEYVSFAYAIPTIKTKLEEEEEKKVCPFRCQVPISQQLSEQMNESESAKQHMRKSGGGGGRWLKCLDISATGVDFRHDQAATASRKH